MNFCLQRLTISRSLLHRRFTASCVSSEFVKTKIENEIGIITLSDPKRLNALTVAMGENFRSAVAELTQAAKEQRIRAVVVTGEGDAFSAGGDLNWLMERHHTSQFKNSDIMVNFYNRFLCIREVGVPTIAAINGAAIGAGMCMTLACDMRVAATNAKLGFTFAKLGIHPGMGSSLLLPRIVSQETASYMLLSGAIISGEDAKQRGLVLETVPKVAFHRSFTSTANYHTLNFRVFCYIVMFVCTDVDISITTVLTHIMCMIVCVLLG